MEYDDIVVVGGGPAGLSAAGALVKVGRRAVVLDRDDVVGSSWLRRYDRLHLHTIRAFSGLAHFPIPRSYPKYLSRTMYAEYLQLYQRHFELPVVHDCTVHRISAIGAQDGGGARFSLVTSQGERRARSVIVATGNFATPVLPDVAGLAEFGGHVHHAAGYFTGRIYSGQRVLVVGLGNTGAEIATDLVEQGASRVAVSVRASPPVVPRDFLGTPVQLFGIALSAIPPKISDAIGATIARVALGDLQRYGLSKPQWLPFSAKRIPVIDVGFVRALKAGQIAVRPTIERFSERGVVFAGGSEEAFDAVIFATGYDTGLRSLLDDASLIGAHGLPVFASGAPTSQPGLYFMGYFESHRGHLFEIALASRRMARIMARDDVDALAEKGEEFRFRHTVSP